MVNNKTTQVLQRAICIQLLLEFFVAKKIAMNETTMNIKSMNCHHIGASAQQLTEQAFAKNKNGVATQCIKHKVLAMIPTVSELSDITFI